MDAAAEKKLRRWMAHGVQSGAYERFVGLPLWKFDQRYAPREVWLPAGRDCFEAAVRVRDKYRHPVSVALTYTLVPGAAIRSGADLESHLDEDEHPALALFPPRPDFLDSETLSAIDPAVLGIPWREGLQAAVQEWSYDERSEEIFRSLVVVSLWT